MPGVCASASDVISPIAGTTSATAGARPRKENTARREIKFASIFSLIPASRILTKAPTVVLARELVAFSVVEDQSDEFDLGQRLEGFSPI
jgi:hypothetical protein